jgi:hypothetical protein
MHRRSLAVLLLASGFACHERVTGGFEAVQAEDGRARLTLPLPPERVAVWGCRRPVRIRFGGGAWQSMRRVEEALWVWRGPPLSRIVELDVDGFVRVAWSAEQEPVEGTPPWVAPPPLGVLSRAEWGARPARCTTPDAATEAVLHHTAGMGFEGPASMRALQAFHQDGRGWCDVGYHFVIGADGRVYEGRPTDVLGAHVGGGNEGRLGIALAGCFDASCPAPGEPSEAAWEALGRLWAELELEGAWAHASLAPTVCPGDGLMLRWEEEALSQSAWPAPPRLRSPGG